MTLAAKPAGEVVDKEEEEAQVDVDEHDEIDDAAEETPNGTGK